MSPIPLNEAFLKSFLNLYWLRPENAILASVQAAILSDVIPPPQGLTVDLSCGDGTFSFILQNGLFDPKFDIFSSIANDNLPHKKKTDVFDHWDNNYRPSILRSASGKITYGMDIKASMLKKAGSLDLYENLVEHDVTQSLPLPNSSANQIRLFSSINHYPRMETLMAELKRVLSPDGAIYITVYMPEFVRLYADLERDWPSSWVAILERGMRDLWPTMFTREQWHEQFADFDLILNDEIPLVSSSFCPMWNVGLRPIAPLMIKLVNSVRKERPEVLAEVKKDWVNLFFELAQPFYRQEENVANAGTLLFVLSKR